MTRTHAVAACFVLVLIIMMRLERDAKIATLLQKNETLTVMRIESDAKIAALSQENEALTMMSCPTQSEVSLLTSQLEESQKRTKRLEWDFGQQKLKVERMTVGLYTYEALLTVLDTSVLCTDEILCESDWHSTTVYVPDRRHDRLGGIEIMHDKTRRHSVSYHVRPSALF